MTVDDKGRYEHSDARMRPLVLFAIGLTLLIIGSLVVSAWMASSFEEEIRQAETPNPLRDFRESPDGPTLQARPTEELVDHRRHEEEVLTSFDWIDPPNGVVRIPIELAMQIVAERGLPELEHAEDEQ